MCQTPACGSTRAGSTVTLPYSHTRPRSLRIRSTIITCSAASLLERHELVVRGAARRLLARCAVASLSSARSATSRPSRRRKRSGDRLTIPSTSAPKRGRRDRQRACEQIQEISLQAAPRAAGKGWPEASPPRRSGGDSRPRRRRGPRCRWPPRRTASSRPDGPAAARRAGAPATRLAVRAARPRGRSSTAPRTTTARRRIRPRGRRNASENDGRGTGRGGRRRQRFDPCPEAIAEPAHPATADRHCIAATDIGKLVEQFKRVAIAASDAQWLGSEHRPGAEPVADQRKRPGVAAQPQHRLLGRQRRAQRRSDSLDTSGSNSRRRRGHTANDTTATYPICGAKDAERACALRGRPDRRGTRSSRAPTDAPTASTDTVIAGNRHHRSPNIAAPLVSIPNVVRKTPVTAGAFL